MGNIINEVLKAIEKIKKKEEFEKLEKLISKSEKIFVYGIGRSGFIGRCFCMRLYHIGLNSFFLGETTTPRFTDKDLMIFISASGEKNTLFQLAKICKRERGKILTITSNKKSKLAKISDNLIYIPTKKSFQFGNSLFEQVCFLFLEEFVQFYIEKNRISINLIKQRHTNLE
ncbi:MAG: SIS domain-containing protein [Candidatus Omnitrophica bacterium]|nr:SIS domain-containing protein [Candidatus Omnitrophota bacterium]MCM8801944.1 SIS domain-containing protein [Candidatus Omnitrophota bacterium]